MTKRLSDVQLRMLRNVQAGRGPYARVALATQVRTESSLVRRKFMDWTPERPLHTSGWYLSEDGKAALVAALDARRRARAVAP